MDGKIFCISDTENPNVIGYEFIKAHPERIEPFNFEESSIDLTVMCEARFVVKGIVYKACAQYFIKESNGNTSRLLLVKPELIEKENSVLTKKHKNIKRYGSGFIPGISDRIIGEDGEPTNKLKPTVNTEKQINDGNN